MLVRKAILWSKPLYYADVDKLLDKNLSSSPKSRIYNIRLFLCQKNSLCLTVLTVVRAHVAVVPRSTVNWWCYPHRQPLFVLGDLIAFSETPFFIIFIFSDFSTQIPHFLHHEYFVYIFFSLKNFKIENLRFFFSLIFFFEGDFSRIVEQWITFSKWGGEWICE